MRHPKGWDCVVAYEIQTKMHIYPLCPNMPGNVHNCFKKNEDLKAHFIMRIYIHNSYVPTLFRDV